MERSADGIGDVESIRDGGRPSGHELFGSSRGDRRHRRRSPVVAGVVVVVVVLSAAIAAGYLRRHDVWPGPSISTDEWSAVGVTCEYGSPINEHRSGTATVVGLAERGGVIDLGTGSQARDDLAGCGGRHRRVDRDTPAPWSDDDGMELDDAHRYFVIPTGRDRSAVRLAAVETTDDGRTRLVVQVWVSGQNCVTTADYRGSLVLLVRGPGDTEIPAADVDFLEEHCG